MNDSSVYTSPTQCHEPVTPPRDSVRLALVTPGRGPAGVFGLSCRMCSELATREINAAGGLLGRRLELVHVDGGALPHQVAREVRLLVNQGGVRAVAGWHTSAVRRWLAPRIGHRVPYIYTALYEGGERTPGVLLTGETPASQLGPALGWMAAELGLRRWFVVGNDYVWPRASAAAAGRWARANGVCICGAAYVPLGWRDFQPVLEKVIRSGASGVLMLLVGQDAVHFNRDFARAGLDTEMVRMSTLMDENMLLASGACGTRNLFATSGYFDNLATGESLDFVGRYARAFGHEAPVPSSLGESCYEGLLLYASLVRRAGTVAREDLLGVAEGTRYEGPRGVVQIRGSHAVQDVYLARADRLEFDVLARLSSGVVETGGTGGAPGPLSC
jgi:urea transport system substrate-binding protein